jgi:hypothetical protein
MMQHTFYTALSSAFIVVFYMAAFVVVNYKDIKTFSHGGDNNHAGIHISNRGKASPKKNRLLEALKFLTLKR